PTFWDKPEYQVRRELLSEQLPPAAPTRMALPPDPDQTPDSPDGPDAERATSTGSAEYWRYWRCIEAAHDRHRRNTGSRAGRLPTRSSECVSSPAYSPGHPSDRTTRRECHSESARRRGDDPE